MASSPKAPTLLQLEKAQRRLEKEYGDPFYRVAMALVRLSKRPENNVSVADALATLLLTWNGGYYRFHPDLRRTLVSDLDDLLYDNRHVLKRLSGASIKTFGTHKEAVREVFTAFDATLGPVGAAKALHLLALRFFPIWDTEIAKGYGVGRPKRAGENATRYLKFMALVQKQCETLPSATTLGRNQLRALDEFNFCRYTRGWL